MKKVLQIFLTILGIIIAVWVAFLLRQQPVRYRSTMTSSIVMRLQAEQQLVSASMTVTKIIESQKDVSDNFFGSELVTQINKFLFDDKLIMTIEGVVNAGIDLRKISADDIQVVTGDPDTVMIHLPEAEIFDVYLTDNTKPFERSVWLLSKWDVGLETQIRNQAISALRQEALSGDLLEQARLSAQNSISKLLKNLDTDLVIEYN